MSKALEQNDPAFTWVEWVIIATIIAIIIILVFKPSRVEIPSTAENPCMEEKQFCQYLAFTAGTASPTTGPRYEIHSSPLGKGHGCDISVQAPQPIVPHLAGMTGFKASVDSGSKIVIELQNSRVKLYCSDNLVAYERLTTKK